MEATAADQNNNTTMVANFVISTLSSFIPALISDAIELARFIPHLAIHLIKLFAVCLDVLCANLLFALDTLFPPGRRIQTIQHYLITTKNALEPVLNRYFEYPLSKFDEIYPQLKQYIMIKLEDAIRFSESCAAQLVSKFNDAFPPGERTEAVWKYMEAGKQYVGIRSENLTVGLNLWDEVKDNVVRGLWIVVGFGLIWMIVRSCCGRRKTKMMAAPGRGGARIRRSDFEGNPKDYFMNLRSRS